MQGGRSRFAKMPLTSSQNLIDETVFNALLGTHKTIPLCVAFNDFHRLTGVLGQHAI
jgi:hypothetical protein